jgi:hypothetical protein
MPLFETLVSAVGPAIAKTLLKVWAGDNKVVSDGGDSAIDMLTKLIPDIRARNEARRQLDSIGERAAESLAFTFEAEGRLLMVEDQEAVASLVARTLDSSKIDVKLLIQKDLEPVELAQHFISEASEELAKLPERRVQLFTRVIEEASQSIVDIAGVLPNFTERTFSELLKRNHVLVDAAHQILENLDRMRTKVDDDREVEATRFETEYRRAVVRNLDRMELFGVDLSRTSRLHPLSIAYVSLDVGGSAKELPATGTEVDNGEVEETDESSVHGVETALADTERLLIRGPAGAGKTTLLRWIAVRAASRSFEYPLEPWNGVIPFLIRLRQFSDSSMPRPEQFPSLVAPSVSDTMPRGWVHRVLNDGSAVVMVDGADEVAESRREEVRTWLKEIVGTFPKCRFVVTSRPHAVEAHWLDDEDFLDTDLQPMDTAGIETFIDHWHMAVGQEVQREEEIASLEHLARRLKSTLRGNLGIRRLATNPLLCSVICALHRDTNEQIPGDRLDLYERCCSMLLERRDPESGLNLKDYPRLSYRQKRSLLDDLAYWMIKNDWSEIPIDSARDRLNRKCETFRHDERDGAMLTGDSSLHFFIERSGILREPLKGKVDFAHRTFQEFMAANAATAEGDIGVLLSNATKTQWREVIALGAGLARPTERADLIKSLISKGDANWAIRPQMYLLAAECLDTAVDVESAIRSEVERRIGDLFPPKNVSDAMQIAEAAGEIAVPFLKKTEEYRSSKESAACVRALAMIGTREAVEAIAEYATDYSSLVLKEVARASERVDPDIYLEVVIPRLDAKRLPGEAVGLLIRMFGFDQVIGLENARELWLTGNGVRDLGFLRKFAALESLKLSGSLVTSLAPLSRLKDLKTLTFERVKVSNFSLLKLLPALENLYFSRCIVDGDQIAEAKGIEMLMFSSGEINNPEALARLPKLRRLHIYSVKVDLAFLQGVKRITHLSLGDFYADAALLGNLDHLRSLSVIAGDVGDLRWLSGLKQLETLDLFAVSIAESAEIPKLASLRKVSIKGKKISSEFADQIRKKYPGAKVGR